MIAATAAGFTRRIGTLYRENMWLSYSSRSVFLAHDLHFQNIVGLYFFLPKGFLAADLRPIREKQIEKEWNATGSGG
jgi:hypothetical protein